MARLFLILFSTSIAIGLHAQRSLPANDVPKKALKLFQKAEKCINKGAFEEAIEKLTKSIEIEPLYLDAHLKLASIYYQNEDFVTAALKYIRAYSLDSSNYRIAQSVAISFEKGGDYENAVDYYQKVLKHETKLNADLIQRTSEKISLLDFRINALARPVLFDPIALPSAINDPNKSEYSPSLTADGRTLFFTRLIGGQEDIYYSERDSLGEWTNAQMLPNLNTLENEGGHNISADGKVILFTYCSNSTRSSLRGCNIYVSFKKKEGWSKPKYFDAINSSAWDSQANISADGNTIIFTSLRKGGKGKSDLWWSKKNSQGKWTKAENLGPQINTSLREESPFFHADGRTLYFKSEGHLGMGSFDLFRTHLQEDGSWSKPENLGYPINTEGHEGSMIVSLDGRTALYSRASGELRFDQTHSDIYSFELPESLRAAPVGFAKIRVFDADTKLPLSASIKVQAQDSMLREFATDEEGAKLVILPLGSKYNIIVVEKNYYFYSERFDLLNENSANSAFEIDVFLKPVKAIEAAENQPIVLKNILFETGSYNFKRESYFELKQLRQLLENNEEIKIEISGHTDDVGNDETNQELSENRAKAVYDYLILNGISKDRLTFVGYGKRRPIASNDTEQGRELNRRTEFIRTE